MRLLFIGDIFGAPGRRIVADHCRDIVAVQGIDLVIANVENAAGGFGITPALAEEILASGVDVMTSGNHIWDKKEILDYLDRQPKLLRPANYPGDSPGNGWIVTQARNGAACAIINLQGRSHMLPIDCPFRKADEILAALPREIVVRFVDFHAELTSEKTAMGWHLDGRVSAVIGTHTHVPTADTRVLPGGTAYQSDVGMTGPYDSVIGVEKQIILQRFLTGLPVRMEAAKGKPELHSVIVDVDENTGKAVAIRRHTIQGD
ncbi:MAG: TIGR00282 family metallophosphoesterase [Bryobacteraceae bacterium]